MDVKLNIYGSGCQSVPGMLVTFGMMIVLISSLCSAQDQGRNLTGVWSSDDGATYFIMRDDDNFVWWVGLSPDNGQSFANVFRGLWHGNSQREEPADYGTVDGEWADVPRGRSMGHGTLRLSYQFSGQLKKVDGPGFNCSTWKKLDSAPGSIDVITNPFPQQGDLSGIWSADSGTYYVRQVGTTVWWFGLRPAGGGNTDAEVFRGTINGTTLSGKLAFPLSGGTNILNAHLDRPTSPNSFTAFGDLGFYGQGTVWRRVNVTVAYPP